MVAADPPWETVGQQDITYQILPVVAALGYGELAITCFPRERTKISACHLAVFSIVLLGLSVLASITLSWLFSLPFFPLWVMNWLYF